MGNGEVGKGDVSSTWWGRQGLLQAPHPINSTVWLGEGSGASAPSLLQEQAASSSDGCNQGWGWPAETQGKVYPWGGQPGQSTCKEMSIPPTLTCLSLLM